MKTVGHRSPRRIASQPSGELLARSAQASAALLEFPRRSGGFIPKGVYHFGSLEQANRHWEQCLARAMARLARKSR